MAVNFAVNCIKTMWFMTKTLYYAVSGSGQGYLFTAAPTRDIYRKLWVGERVGFYPLLIIDFLKDGLKLPEMKWIDNPVKLELNIKVL